jgi:hypothetical protein
MALVTENVTLSVPKKCFRMRLAEPARLLAPDV